jgi:hypothetical protein
MDLILILCCDALINPFYSMVETAKPEYKFSLRLLCVLAGLTAGGTIAQAIGCVAAYLLLEDSQAGGMLAHLIMQHLSYYYLGLAFIVLSLSNLLIKKGLNQLKSIRIPSLILIGSVSIASYLLIPRMDYLRETALQDGMPVMLSPFATYFVILNSLTFLLLCAQIYSSVLLAWRLSDVHSSEVRSESRN